MTLYNSYMIVVPSTLGSKAAPAGLVDPMRKEVKVAFAAAFGGFTETKGLGGYVSEAGDLIEEDVYQITAWTKHRNDGVIHRLAKIIKFRLQQETVFYQINEQAYIE